MLYSNSKGGYMYNIFAEQIRYSQLNRTHGWLLYIQTGKVVLQYVPI
jgi:hypothetical protein